MSETFDYNTGRERLVIPEYGRHIQKLINHCKKLENREERTRMAYAIVEVMGNLNPQIRDSQDFRQKLWDHLFIMSNYELDVDAPYPKPSPEEINKKPEPMSYPSRTVSYRHYGQLVASLIHKAVAMEEGPEKKHFIHVIANLMKKYYLTYNRESVEDRTIFQDIAVISGGKIKITEEDIKLTSSEEILARNHYATKRNNNKKKKKRRKF